MITSTCEGCKKSFKHGASRDAKFCSLRCRDMVRVGKKATNYRHGGNLENKPEHNSWRAMKERCLNPNYWCFHRYGGRGIKITDRWLGRYGFNNFLSDMGKKPSPKHSLDRLDTDGDYTPENCRWSDEITQKNNTSRNRHETIDGVTKTVSQWCKEYDISVTTIYNRIGNGWSFEEALKTPAIAGRRFLIRPLKSKLPRKDCANCGKECNGPRQKYCGNECYLFARWGYVKS